MLLPLLAALLLAALLLGVGIGAVALSPATTIAILLNKLGIDATIAFTPEQATVLWVIRLPRVLLAALATGAAVAVAGPIGFVGLIVPHIVRLLAGPDHRRLLPPVVWAGPRCW